MYRVFSGQAARFIRITTTPPAACHHHLCVAVPNRFTVGWFIGLPSGCSHFFFHIQRRDYSPSYRQWLRSVHARINNAMPRTRHILLQWYVRDIQQSNVSSADIQEGEMLPPLWPVVWLRRYVTRQPRFHKAHWISPRQYPRAYEERGWISYPRNG